MKSSVLLLLISVFVFLTHLCSCGKGNNNDFHTIIGDWKLVKVINNHSGNIRYVPEDSVLVYLSFSDSSQAKCCTGCNKGECTYTISNTTIYLDCKITEMACPYEIQREWEDIFRHVFYENQYYFLDTDTIKISAKEYDFIFTRFDLDTIQSFTIMTKRIQFL